MLANIQNVAVQVLVLFILIAIGFFCQRVRLLNDAVVKGLSDLVVYIITPANIISAFLREFRYDLLLQLGLAFVVAFLVYTIATLLSKLLIRDRNESRRVVLRFAASYPNAGYMGIPLQRAILGDIGVFFCAAYIAVFHMYIWTYGCHLLSSGKEKFSIKKIILNPVIISIAVGLLLFLTQLPLPEIIYSPIQHLSALATPVPMLIIGYYLAGSNLKEIFGNAWIYIAAFIKLIASPLIALGICRLMGMDTTFTVSCLIATSASSAAMTTMLAVKFDRDARVAAGMVSFTTIMAIITMPVIIALAQL